MASAELAVGWRDRLRAALLLALPLSLFAELLLVRTHHRPLGAATFASVSLVGFALVWLTAARFFAPALASTAPANTRPGNTAVGAVPAPPVPAPPVPAPPVPAPPVLAPPVPAPPVFASVGGWASKLSWILGGVGFLVAIARLVG